VWVGRRAGLCVDLFIDQPWESEERGTLDIGTGYYMPGSKPQSTFLSLVSRSLSFLTFSFHRRSSLLAVAADIPSICVTTWQRDGSTRHRKSPITSRHASHR